MLKSKQVARSTIVFALAYFCAGCVHFPVNEKLKAFDYRQGYRFENLVTAPDADELFIVLSFSGGGTRAAAFSYGVMQELRRTPNPLNPKNSLLDEVDVMSSVSGGSFTSAYYAVYHDKLFTDFEHDFLKKDIQGGLLLKVLNPVDWWALASPYYSRIDLASDYFDETMFHGHTFQDLQAKSSRPYLIVNSTDMSLGSRFEFTQDQFDLLDSDLNSVHVARAVAASSAFPVLLCPVTLVNYGDRPANYTPPGWLDAALQDREISPRRYAAAINAQSYLEQNKKPFIHLLDGGISDNIGLRGIWQSLAFPDVNAPPHVKDPRGLNLNAKIANHKIRRLVFITVDAKPADSSARDLSKRTPGILDVVLNISTMPMANYSFDTEQLLRNWVETETEDQQRHPSGSKGHKLEVYYCDVSFAAVADPEIRASLESLGTNYNLKDCQIDLLRTTAAETLRQCKAFQDLISSLKQQASDVGCACSASAR